MAPACEISQHTDIVTEERPQSHGAVQRGRQQQLMIFNERHARDVLHVSAPLRHHYNTPHLPGTVTISSATHYVLFSPVLSSLKFI